MVHNRNYFSKRSPEYFLNIFYNPAVWRESFYGCDRFRSSVLALVSLKGEFTPIIKAIRNMYFLLSSAQLLKLEISAFLYIQ